MSQKNTKLLVTIALSLLTGCGGSPDSSTSQALSAPTVAASGNSPSNGSASNGTDTGTTPIKPRIYSRALVSCNPLTGQPQAVDYNLGLSARLYYGSVQYSSVEDYISNDTDLGVDIFFNNVDVIPTYFSSGFPSEAGAPFALPDGTVLIEWFAIRYQSTLRLTSNDQPGNYQFATLSDDGSILYLDPTGGSNPVEFVNNDGQHATQLECSNSTVAMDANSQIPIRLDYFQGPRYHLTSMLLWRRIPAGGSLSDSACGVQGIDTFFDTTKTPAAPQPYYQQLLSRGWEVVPAENFVLPNTNPENPCFPGNGILGN